MTDRLERDQLMDLLSKLTEDADLDKRIAKMEDNYLKESEIDDLIWKSIRINQGNIDKLDKAVDKANEKNNLTKINYTTIIQTVIAALIIAIISYMIQNRG
jgi:large-conductance mechanosensitive channel